MIDDPYTMDWDELRLKLRLNFGLARSEPFMVIEPDYERLPEPLRPSARQMNDRSLTRQGRLAAAQEFIVLSGEWLTTREETVVEMTRESVEELPWIEVPNSSNIERFAWGERPDEQADVATLHVQFAGGRVYAYADVPYEVNRGMVKAIELRESVGSFVAHNVRGKFETERIEVEEDDE